MGKRRILGRGRKMAKRSIRELRASKKMSQTELAKKLGVSTMYVAIWEQLDTEKVAEIASAFGVSANEIQIPANYD